MIAKLITFGKSREDAIQRMIRAIEDYTITGIETTLSFGTFVMQHEAFVAGNFDTKFIDRYFTPEQLTKSENMIHEAGYIASYLYQKQKQVAQVSAKTEEAASNWKKNRKLTQ
jgi:acetyl/propionyl-CoA carboxylase alpha subunit